MGKFIKWTLAVVLAALVAAVAGAYLFARAKGQPQVDGTLKLAGLTTGLINTARMEA